MTKYRIIRYNNGYKPQKLTKGVFGFFEYWNDFSYVGYGVKGPSRVFGTVEDAYDFIKKQQREEKQNEEWKQTNGKVVKEV